MAHAHTCHCDQFPVSLHVFLAISLKLALRTYCICVRYVESHVSVVQLGLRSLTTVVLESALFEWDNI